MINSINSDMAVTHDNELANILTNFNTDYIYLMVNEALKMRLRNYEARIPNAVVSIEQLAKQVTASYPQMVDQMKQVRNETYEEIIKILCNFYGMQYNDNDSFVDTYTGAMLMYSFLVSDFQNNIITFFTNFIIAERSSIYESLKLSDARKSKDSSTIYGKKIFKNPKLAVISANLEMVLRSIITSYDIDFNTYLSHVYVGAENKEIARQLSEILSPIENFLRTAVGPCFNTEYGPVLITQIRLSLQKSAEDLVENNIIKD